MAAAAALSGLQKQSSSSPQQTLVATPRAAWRRSPRVREITINNEKSERRHFRPFHQPRSLTGVVEILVYKPSSGFV